MIVGWLALAATNAWAGTCTITAEGAPTRELECARAGLWALACNAPAKGRRRVQIAIPEWDVQAVSRLPLGAEDRFELTLLGPSGSPNGVDIDGLNPQNWKQAVSALDLCRPYPAPVTLQVSVTAHPTTGFAEEVDENGVINRVPTYGAGQVVATAEAKVKPPLVVSDAPTTSSRQTEPARGRLQVRRGDRWVDLRWDGDKQWLPAEGGSVTLLRLDFPREQVEAALGPGDAPELLARDLTRWLSGDVESRLGLVAFRRSGVPVPVAEVPTFDLGDGGWRRAAGGTTDLAIGPVSDSTVRVAIAFRSAPLDEAARSAARATARAARRD